MTAAALARRAVAVVALAFLTVAIVLGGLYLRAPAQALNVADAALPGGGARASEAIRFDRATGLALDVWSPARPGPHPVLLFFHGGSWVDGRRQDYGFVARAYAARGFVVVVPDYRKLPEGRFPAFMQDAARALGWTARNVARYGGDPARIAVAGHSVGGYIAVMLALDRRWSDRAGVRPDTVRAAVALAGPYAVYPFRWRPARDALGGASDPRDIQPLALARRDAPPLWLATGDADVVVAPANSRALARRQRALGDRTTMLRVYPGLGHSGIVMALSRPFRTIAPVMNESVAFLNANLVARR
ncbi:MAG: alpha/beta hydrolase [Sphingomonas sp.]